MRKLVMILVVLSLVNVAAASYVETFNSDNASWNYGYGYNFGTILPATWVSTGGNPDGHISGLSQNLWAVWTYVTAPYGDMTGGLTMTIDTKITDAETGNAQFYVGINNDTYYINGAWDISKDLNWTTHTTVLDSAHFTLWSGSKSLAEVLAAPTDIGIWFEGGVANGTGNLLVDNFGTIPEPATMCLLGLGVLGLLRKRRV